MDLSTPLFLYYHSECSYLIRCDFEREFIVAELQLVFVNLHKVAFYNLLHISKVKLNLYITS